MPERRAVASRHIAALFPDGTTSGFEMQDALVAATPEQQCRVVQRGYKPAVDKRIYPLQATAQRLVAQELLIGVTGIAPYILVRFAFETLQQLVQCRRIIERVTARERNAIEQYIIFDFPDDTPQYGIGQRLSGIGTPTVGIVTSGTGMAATGQVDGIAQPVTVGYRLRIYV